MRQARILAVALVAGLVAAIPTLRADDKPTPGGKAWGCKKCAEKHDICGKGCEKGLYAENGNEWFIPLTGLPAGEKAAAAKLDQHEAIARYTFVKLGKKVDGVLIALAPGKSLKVADLDTALKGTKVGVNEDAPILARFTVLFDGPMCEKCTAKVQDAVEPSTSGFEVKNIDKTKCYATVDMTLTQQATIKKLKEQIKALNFRVAHLEMTAPAK